MLKQLLSCSVGAQTLPPHCNKAFFCPKLLPGHWETEQGGARQFLMVNKRQWSLLFVGVYASAVRTVKGT